MKVCPTTALQPSLMEAGLEGLWTPHMVPRLGYCDYGCNACGQICPSGAIPLLELAEKREAKIGTAVIDHNLCLPWAHGIMCIVCEEMCPKPDKAIHLEEAEVVNAQGETVIVQRPYVLEDVCIGCGICENRCPVVGEAAITVRRA
jgi:formate hydrogenlyase subunit 6/NADH:ubiquinone oxidoreductase subunit I